MITQKVSVAIIGDILIKSLQVVKPSEMLKVHLTLEQLEKIEERTNEVEVNCTKRG